MSKRKLITATALCCAGLLLVVSIAASFVGDRWVDQDKFFRHPTHGWILYYIDEDCDRAHGPGEYPQAGPVVTNPYGAPPLWRPDNSCWMASAANMMQAAGFGNAYALYVNWTRNGTRPSPTPSPWGDAYTANSGDAFTYDDGGWQQWALIDGGCGVEFIRLESEGSRPYVWKNQQGGTVNAIEWCMARLDGTRGVGLVGPWRLADLREPAGGRDRLGHAITLWGIVLDTPGDTSRGTVSFTDSDDGAAGLVQKPFEYDNSVWKINQIYGTDTLWISYACWITSGPTAVKDTSWGAIKSLYR